MLAARPYTRHDRPFELTSDFHPSGLSMSGLPDLMVNLKGVLLIAEWQRTFQLTSFMDWRCSKHGKGPSTPALLSTRFCNSLVLPLQPNATHRLSSLLIQHVVNTFSGTRMQIWQWERKQLAAMNVAALLMAFRGILLRKSALAIQGQAIRACPAEFLRNAALHTMLTRTSKC